MIEKVRISKSGKFAQLFPENVAKWIKGIAEDYLTPIKSLSYSTESPTRQFYVGEGERFEAIGPDGQTTGFEVVSSNTVGASGLSHRIGATFSMPEGSYLIRISYWGKYVMDVYYIEPMPLPSEIKN